MTVDELCNAFAVAAEEHKSRLNKASDDIDRIRKDIANDNEPTGYRVEWTRKAAVALAGTLQEQCAIFDAEHPKDRASATDCLNVTLTLANMLLHQAGMRLVQLDNHQLVIAPL